MSDLIEGNQTISSFSLLPNVLLLKDVKKIWKNQATPHIYVVGIGRNIFNHSFK